MSLEDKIIVSVAYDAEILYVKDVIDALRELGDLVENKGEYWLASHLRKIFGGKLI